MLDLRALITEGVLALFDLESVRLQRLCPDVVLPLG